MRKRSQKRRATTERRRDHTDLGLDLGDTEEQVVCHALGDDRQSTSTSRDVSLAIFIPFESGSESFTSFINRIFHFSGPPGLRLMFNAAKRNGRYGCIQCQRSKDSNSSRGKRRRQVFLCRRRVRIKVKRKIIPASFLKIEGRARFVGAKEG